MRRLLASVLAGLLAFSAPGFAQNATPVLIDQSTPQSGSSGQPTDDGQTALAQAPPDLTPPPTLNPLGVALVVGGIAGAIVIIVNQNKNDDNPAPVSP